MDPIGNISPFLTMTAGLNPKRQTIIILREMLIALLAMLFFNYLGEVIFYFLDISEAAVEIASGIILLLIAIKILFTSPDSMRANIPKGEPLIFPLAIPLIAGPALLATIMLYAHLESLQSVMIFAILIAWFCSSLILFSSRSIKKILGTNGLIACERLIGMVLVLISVQRLLEGFLLFWSEQSKLSS
jgi:multiple antibiotic resistance protein